MVYRNTCLGNQKLLIIDLIVNIILDYLKNNVHNLFTITGNIEGGILSKMSLETFKGIVKCAEPGKCDILVSRIL